MGVKELIFRFGEQVEADKPELLLAGGIGLIVAGGIWACKRTMKVNDILEEHRQTLAIIREKEDAKNVKTQVYAKTTLDFVKTYAPPVLVATVGVIFICMSHHVMTERNAAVTAALSATSAAFTEYRDRVRKEVGDEVEQMIFDGGHREKVEVETVNEKGKKKTELIDKVVYDNKPISPFSILFDGKSEWWRDGCPAANATVVHNVQSTANQLLKSRSVTLKDVIEMLGFTVDMEKDPNAYIYANFGWRMPAEHEPMKFIDFGLDSPRCKDFGTLDDCAWLVFNVDPEPLWKGNKSVMSLVDKAA